ncbi:MAG: DUF6495 family protein [Aureispira sp.]
MRFRRLKKEELEALEEDFVQFLASNHITAKEWTALKASENEKVYELLDVFSDIVFEKIYSKVDYLQHRTKDTVRVFHCQEDKIVMTGLRISDATRDLTQPEDIAILADASQLQGPVKIFQIEKAYSKERAEEIFLMIEKDRCQPAPRSMFDALIAMYQSSN